LHGQVGLQHEHSIAQYRVATEAQRQDGCGEGECEAAWPKNEGRTAAVDKGEKKTRVSDVGAGMSIGIWQACCRKQAAGRAGLIFKDSRYTRLLSAVVCPA